jgi:hypothetical protein
MHKGAVAGPVHLRLWLACVLSLLVECAHARIYTCETETGRVVLRDVPCKKSEIAREPRAVPAPPASVSEPKAVPKARAKLNDSLVRELAQSLEAAFVHHDPKLLQPLLASDAVFELDFRLPQGAQVVRYNLDEYSARWREGFKLPDYSYQRERGDIVLSPGEEHAEIIESARQTVWFQGQWQAASARNRWSVEMRDGRPQVTLLRAVITP